MSWKRQSAKGMFVFGRTWIVQILFSVCVRQNQAKYTYLCNVNELGLYLCVVSLSKLLGMLMMEIASKGHLWRETDWRKWSSCSHHFVCLFLIFFKQTNLKNIFWWIWKGNEDIPWHTCHNQCTSIHLCWRFYPFCPLRCRAYLRAKVEFVLVPKFTSAFALNHFCHQNWEKQFRSSSKQKSKKFSQKLPALLTGQIFLHSWLHLFGLQRSLFAIAILVPLFWAIFWLL